MAKKKRENGTNELSLFDLFDDVIVAEPITKPKKITAKENVIKIKGNKKNEIAIMKNIEKHTKEKEKCKQIDSSPFEKLDDIVQQIIHENKYADVKDYLTSRENIPNDLKKRLEANMNILKLFKNNRKNKDVLRSEENKRTLAKYSGWGGLSSSFQSETKKNEELKSLMLKEEYESAKESTLTSFYTPLYMIKFIYSILNYFGFESGKILDPSTGTGRFLAGMSEDMYYTSKITAVEVDKISYEISNILYNQSQVINSKFEDVKLKDDSFDLCISNIPFGSFKVYDTIDKDLNEGNHKIHDYFFAKAIKKTRVGGLIAFVTSCATLDSNSGKKIREEIDKKCDFLCAVRFPKNTFLDTQVGCDVIFLQKTGKKNKRKSFLDVTEVDGITMNEYYHSNNNMIICDDMVMETFGPNKNEIMKGIIKGELTGEKLKSKFKFKNIEELHDIYESQADDSYMYEDDELKFCDDENIKLNEIVNIDYSLYQRQDKFLIPINFMGKRRKILLSYIEVKDALKNVIKTQLKEHTESEFKDTLKALNDSYDTFISKFGNINSRSNKTILSNDIYYYNVAALENFNYSKKVYEKAEIFYKKSIVTHEKKDIKTPHEAYKMCICKKGYLDIDYMCEILKDTDYEKEGILSELCDKNLIMYKPYLDKYVKYNDFTSGYTKHELDRHELEYKKLINDDTELNENEKELKDFKEKHYLKNIEILKDNQPEYIDDVFFSFASTWIPLEYKRKFISSILRVDEDELGFTYDKALGYTLKTNAFIRYSTEDEYGTKRRKAISIIENTLNMKDIVVTDKLETADGKEKSVKNIEETQAARNMQEKIRVEFDGYIANNIALRTELVDMYNDKFNSYVEKSYDNILFDLDINPNITLREHQLKGASRIITSKFDTLLAHSVGSGKTYTMITASQELIAINTFNNLPTKNLIVIPNSLCESGQFAKDYLTLYPHANILATTSKDLSSQNRRRFMAKVVANDYDAIIIAHSSLLKIPLRRETELKYIQEDLDELERLLDFYRRENMAFTVKKIESMIKKYETKLIKLNDLRRDDAIYNWEDLGITNIFVDEAHNFKNLDFPTRLQVAGLSTSNADKSKDLYTKLRYMKEKVKHSKVIFASATPVSNSLSELYTLQRYLMPQELSRLEVDSFDAWASTFAQVSASMEIDSTGTGCKSRQRIHLYNIPELINIFKKSADVVHIENIEDIKLPKLKDNKTTIVELEPTELMEMKIDELIERSYKIEQGGVDQEVDNMLMIINEGKFLVISPRLLGIDEDSIKVASVAENVSRLYKERDDTTHLIFCDYGTPDSKTYNVYEELKRKLIEFGVQEKDVAFIHDANTPEKRKQMIKEVRDCDVRVLIGSSPKLAEGVNLQDYLYSVHHLSVPWRPSDIEQRNGRMIRQHNKNDIVEEFRYVVKNSFDAFSWQLIEQKEKDIRHILKGDKTLRSLEDISDHVWSYAETKASACGDTRILELNTIDQELRKLQFNEREYMDRKTRNYRKIKEYSKRLQYLQENMPLFKQDILDMVESIKQDNLITVEGYESAEDMEEVTLNFKEILDRDLPGKLGTIYGLDMFYDKYDKKIYIGKSKIFWIKHYRWHNVMLKNLFDIKNIAKSIYKQYAEEYKIKLEEFNSLKIVVGKPFKDQEKLNSLQLKKKELENSLLIDTSKEIVKNGKMVV